MRNWCGLFLFWIGASDLRLFLASCHCLLRVCIVYVWFVRSYGFIYGFVYCDCVDLFDLVLMCTLSFVFGRSMLDAYI